MKIYVSILFFLLLWGEVTAQSYTYTHSRFKGTYGDGQDRSPHSFVIEKVKAPTILCEGDTAVFSIGYEGTYVLDFKWKKVGDKRESWCDSAVMKIEGVTTAHRGKYYCCLIDVRSGVIRYSDTVELKIRKRPTALIASPAAPYMQCYGDSTILSAVASEDDKEKEDVYTYFWSGPNIQGASNEVIVTVKPKESARYVVTVNNGGCLADTAFEMEVYKPEVHIPDVIYLTEGMPLQLAPVVPSTAVLDWKVGSVTVSDMNPLEFNGIEQTTAVDVIMTDRGCVAKSSGMVYFKRGRGYKGGEQDGFDRSDHTFHIENINGLNVVCERELVRFSIEYEGTYVFDYEWHKIGDNNVLGDSSVLIIPEAGLKARGEYYCKLTDISSGKAFYSDTVELKVKKLPVAVIGSPESPKLVCYGDTIMLNASASEAGKETGDVYTYSWSGEGIVSSSNQPFVRVSPQENTVYTVTVSNSGCVSDTTVEVISYRPVVELPDYVYVSEGNTLELSVDVPDAAKLIWNAAGNVFEDINPFVYPSIRETMEVSVKMVNEGCEASDKCKVYVKRGRGNQGGAQDGFDRSCNPPLILEQNRSEASCLATGAQLWVKADGSSLKYIWQKFNNETKLFEEFVPAAGREISGLETGTLTFDNLLMEDNGVYLCKIENACGSVTTDTFSLSVGGVPVLKSGLNREWDQCVDGHDSTHLNIAAMDPQGKEMKYSWYKVDTVTGRYKLLKDTAVYNQPYLKLLLQSKADEGIYLVNVHNECGDTRDSVFVPVNMPVRIVRDGATKKKIVACAGGQAEFAIRVTGGGKVRYSLTKVKQVISDYPIQYLPDYSIVGGSKIVLDHLTKADEGNYVWEVDNGCGRDTLGFIELRVEIPPVIEGSSDTIALCEGESLQLKCQASSPFSELKYEWYKNGVSTGVKVPYYNINRAVPSHEGNYVCQVSNSCPVVEGPVRTVVIKERPKILDRPYIKDFYCQSDTLSLKVELGSVRVDSLRWFHDGNPVSDVSGRIEGSVTPGLAILGVLPEDEGGYRIQAYNECGASDFSEMARLVIDRPAHFVKDLSGYTDLVLCDGADQALTVSTTGTAPIRYIWTHNAKILADGFSSTIHLNNVKADTAGLYCCEIQNRCGGEVACAQIKVSHPDTFRFELNSVTNEVCEGDPDGLTAVLMGSDTNTLYSLYKEPGVLVTKIHGKDLVMPGGFIEFKGLLGGSYYVMAEDTRYAGGCTYRMPGEVVITEYPLPVKYELFIKEHFCKDLHLASLALTKSERDVGIEYTLYKLDASDWVPYLNKIKGTGDTIVWQNVPAGDYKVSASDVTTGCRVDMEHVVSVSEYDLPKEYELDAWNNDSVYCANVQTDVVLELSGVEPNTKYTLYRQDGLYRPGAYSGSWSEVEEGMYYVEGVNQWGCRREMGYQHVVMQQPPLSTSIQGGMIYCENQSGTAQVEIKNTNPAYLYRIYREFPKVEYLDTMGNGGAILLRVPLEDRSYYVVAEDTTREHCRTVLSDTAVFKMSRLRVTGNPEEHILWNGEQCQLPISIVGQEGKVSVSWSPAEKLIAGQDTLQAPMTLPVTERQDYIVRVQDYSACVATATVSVIVKSDKLACDIRMPDKVTSIDTLKACREAGIDLYAWGDGGTGVYEYKWRDESGILSETQLLHNYSRVSDGWLVLEVKSAAITQKDSVWIELYSTPEEYALLPGGLLCVQKNSEPQLKLSGFQMGVRYILSYSTDRIRFNDIDTIECTGADVIFRIEQAYTREGYYAVRAEYPHGVITCVVPMRDTVEIRKGAEIFALTGDKEYCEGTAERDTIRLAYAERGVVYSLYRESSAQVLQMVPGQNQALMFVGDFGNGTYFVTATQGVCIDTMSGKVEIIRNSNPADLGIVEKGSYCEGNYPSNISVRGAEAEVEYVLMRKNFGVEDTEVERLKGAGNLAFAGPEDEGEYYIIAYGQNGCERIFKDRLYISGTLTDVNVDGDRKFCDSESGYTGWLKITNPQDGVNYRILTESGSVAGNFDSVTNVAAFFRGVLAEGNYKIQAVAGNCSLDLVQTIKIERKTLPANATILAPYTLCSGDGQLAMSVVSSVGYQYTLYRDSSGIVTQLDAKAGTGGSLYLGRYDRVGDYYVEVTYPSLGCVWTLSDKYHIAKPLKEFSVLGDTVYCASEEGVVIKMDGTENNVVYVLQKWDKVYGEYRDVDRLTGRGMAVAFKGYYPEGKYRVKAVRGCEKVMRNELNVRSKAAPADSTLLVLDGNGCVDSTFVIRLEKSEPGVVYSLYYDGIQIGNVLEGDDLYWTVDKAKKGTYKVTANKNGCVYVFPKKVEIGDLPFIYPLYGDTLLCANLYGELYMTNWDREATYVLYNEKKEEIAKGAESDGKLYFSSVPVGTVYPVAARGNCEVAGKPFTVDSISVPVLSGDNWQVSKCVKRGEGEIVISGMADTLRYLLTAGSGGQIMDYRGEQTDTVFRNLVFDHYCLVAEDERSHCRSEELCVTINESVTDDSLAGDFSYCAGEAGAVLYLSGNQRGMVYQMLTLEGDLIEEIQGETLRFSKNYKKGQYLFRKERVGVLGGCFAIDTVDIDSFAYPLTNIVVEITGGENYLCENGDYGVKLLSSELGYEYRLIKDPGTQSEVNIDTVVGTGGELIFSKVLKEKGLYKVYAQPLGGDCGLYLDTAFRLYGVPKVITAEGCSYCVAIGGQDSCSIKVSGLTGGVQYVLSGVSGMDTVYGPGKGVFPACAAGAYVIIGEDRVTFCKDTVAEVRIEAMPMPKVFAVTPVCGQSGEIGTLNGSEGDTISYYLYKDGVQCAGPVKGNGGNISFGVYSEPGVYKIKALSERGCESWMEDSATLYVPLSGCDLSKEGYYCQNGVTGVTLKYGCSSLGWNYYLQKATVWSSDTLKGTGGELSWTTIDGNRILSGGKYDLYAVNACENRFLKSITIKENPLPAVMKLEGKDEAVCSGTGVDIILSGSQMRVHYQLMYVNGGTETELKNVAGSGGELYLGNYSAIGQYIVYAIVDSSGCRLKMDDKMFYPGSAPEVKKISGTDLCLNGVSVAEMNVCITAPLQTNVDYILYFTGKKEEGVRDTLLSGNPDLCFETQRDTGCYYVVAKDVASGCEKTMEGKYCMGLPPLKYNVIRTEDTVKLCRGEKYCVRLGGSDVGVKYVLMRDGMQQGEPVVGSGMDVDVGCVTEPGVYKVKAYAGDDCWQMMNDSILVRVNELQGMFVQKQFSYCSLEGGVVLGVKQPTSVQCKYTLKSPEGIVLEERSGDVDGKGFEFTIAGAQQMEGYYEVSVLNPAGCRKTDSVEVKINPLPTPYVLGASNGEWLCVNGRVEMYMDSTQTGVEYHLYWKNAGEADKEIEWKYGNGDRLVLTTVDQPGEYYVEGVDYTTGCKNSMLNLFRLKQADTVRVFKLEGIKTGYCYTDPAKGSLHLLNSVAGVEYELFRDGVSTGAMKPGNGGVLVWEGLEGQPCSNKVNVTDAGYIYEVLARDTLTGCVAWMNGKIGIVEESDPAVTAWHPNKDLMTCQGKDVKFSLSATGCNLNYVWKRDETVVKDSIEEFYNIDEVSAVDFGYYHCEISNSCGIVSTPPVQLKVRDSLFYLKRMEDKAVCGNTGESVMLTGYIQNGRSYEWYRLDDPMPLSYSEWYKIRSVQPEDAGIYIFRAENECGQLTDTMELKVDAEPSNEPVVFRTDTICAGTSYYLSVVSPDTVKWYRDGVYLGVTGNDLLLAAARPEDEGLYSVRVVNACAPAGRTIAVAQLYVDDTIRVISLRPSELVCENAAVDLYIRTSPEKRVSYVWETGGVIIAQNRNTYRTPPLTSDDPVYTYFVNYRNKCTDSTATIRLSVSNKLEYKDPVPQMLMCAEPGRDTAIFIEHPATLIASYQWYWQELAEGSIPVKLEGEVYDTLYLGAATKNVGYYYCEIGKVCNPVTTQSCWVRIDTVPVLQGSLPAMDTTCENAVYRWELAATGGGLIYEWNFLLKDGSVERYAYENALLSSTGYYEMKRVEAKYDSCRIFCRVFNDCGEVYSDTMSLCVKPAPRVELTPADTIVCEFASVLLQAELQSGAFPWSYGYSVNGGEVQERICKGLTDTLPYGGAGNYRIEWIETGGCRVVGLAGSAEVKELPATKVSLIRENFVDTVCESDTLYFRMVIEGGIGPWEIGIKNQDGLAASELGLSYPFTLSEREKRFEVPVYWGQYYYIDTVRDLNAVNACPAFASDTVKIVVDDFLPITFRTIYDHHVGSCRAISLDSMLAPTPAGGQFYVNHEMVDSLWLPQGPFDTIRYQLRSSRGCINEQRLIFAVDTLPWGQVMLSDVACGSTEEEVRIQLYPSSQGFELELRQSRYKQGNRVPIVTDRQISLNETESGLFRETVDWGVVDGVDSCLVYEITALQDRHGCSMSFDVMEEVKDSLLRAAIVWHQIPVMEVRTRWKADSTWYTGSRELNICEGDSVEVQVHLLTELPVWHLPGVGIETIYSSDTVFYLKEQGSYLLSVEDSVCGMHTVADSIKISFAQDAYFRGKLWLEGPYDPSNGRMWSAISSQLHLPAPSSLPLLPSGIELIDRIVLEFRTGTNADSVALLGGDCQIVMTDTCYLASNGRLVDRFTGDTLIRIKSIYNTIDNHYYLAVRHRNHLGVMTASAFELTPWKQDAPMIDFTHSSTIYTRDGELRNHMTLLPQGNGWMLSAGELNDNKLITLFDPNVITLEDFSLVGSKAYDLLHDLNFDGKVEWPGGEGTSVPATTDWNIVKRNRQKYSEVR